MMPIDITKEEPIPLTSVPKLKCVPRQPNGKASHISTWFRYAKKGLRGVKLETIKAGSKLCTSVEAIQRFFDRLSLLSDPGMPVYTISKQRQQEVKRAKAKLIQAGIKSDKTKGSAEKVG